MSQESSKPKAHADINDYHWMVWKTGRTPAPPTLTPGPSLTPHPPTRARTATPYRACYTPVPIPTPSPEPPMSPEPPVVRLPTAMSRASTPAALREEIARAQSPYVSDPTPIPAKSPVVFTQQTTVEPKVITTVPHPVRNNARPALPFSTMDQVSYFCS